MTSNPPSRTFGGFGATSLVLNAFGAVDGWVSNDQYPHYLADVNGDGMADIIGFSSNGIVESLATGGGSFGATSVVLQAFSPGDGWTSNNTYPRLLADVNGDLMADTVGFSSNGFVVSLATGGGAFGAANLLLPALGASQGWTSDDTYPRFLADVTGDHAADIVGFSSSGVIFSGGLFL